MMHGRNIKVADEIKYLRVTLENRWIGKEKEENQPQHHINFNSYDT
jgi:hypothetical protein